jgi:hypothetical protein
LSLSLLSDSIFLSAVLSNLIHHGSHHRSLGRATAIQELSDSLISTATKIRLLDCILGTETAPPSLFLVGHAWTKLDVPDTAALVLLGQEYRDQGFRYTPDSWPIEHSTPLNPSSAFAGLLVERFVSSTTPTHPAVTDYSIFLNSASARNPSYNLLHFYRALTTYSNESTKYMMTKGLVALVLDLWLRIINLRTKMMKEQERLDMLILDAILRWKERKNGLFKVKQRHK